MKPKVLCFLALALSAAGCNMDEVGLDSAGRGLGTSIQPTSRTFHIAVLAPSEAGDLILDGDDLTYDRGRGEVSFHVTLTNPTDQPIFAPLTLVISDLHPSGVQIIGADGHGDDGSPLFDFSRALGEDGTLAPGESSLPLRMTVSDPSGGAFELGGVVESGIGPSHGSVGGVIFLDQNPNGRRDHGEPGIPGIPLALYSATKCVAKTRSDRAGRYHFDELPPGLYAVHKGAPDLATVAPNPLHVALIPAGRGQAASFLGADFACFRRSQPGRETTPILGPLRVLAHGETITGHFSLAELPRMPLLLLVEVVRSDKRPLSSAEVMINGHPVLTAADLTADARLARAEIMPDILRVGENTLEARAERSRGDEVVLVVTVFGQ